MKSPRLTATLLAVSAAGLVAIASHEDVRPVAYVDPVGIPTICAGHTAGVRIGQRATINGCLVMLHEDASEAGRGVASCTAAPLTQAQYDALTSFAFNVGTSAYCRSTLVKKLNSGNCHGAAAEFDRWVYAKGRKLPGLVKRRADERARFETGCERSEA